jgi:uncharacterized glyoxalase superfamily protein PhnB
MSADRNHEESAMALPRPTFISSIIYKDQRAAIAWLEKAFGFEVSELLVDGQDNILHAEMSFGDGVIMIGSEWFTWTRSPAAVDGANTQRLHVRVTDDVDAHCERARAAGAAIVKEPEDQFYGDRTYIAKDLEGHHWSFAQPKREVSWDEMRRMAGAGKVG